MPQEALRRRRGPLRGAGGDKDTMNKPNENQAGRRERRHFDETYKRHAVELTLRGDRSVRAIAEELGVTDSMLYEWRRIYAPKPSASGPAPRSLEDAQEGDHAPARRGRAIARAGDDPKKIAGHPLRTARSGMPGSTR